MKKLLIIIMASVLLFGMGTTAWSAPESQYEFDASIGFGSGLSDFDTSFGLNVGAGSMMSAINSNLQARVDLSYFDFTQDVFGTTLRYTRVPVGVSGRYFLPLSDEVKPFAQLGLEVSFDSFEYVDFAGKHSKTESNLGLTPGFGVEFAFTQNVGLFAIAQYHIVTDHYYDMLFGTAFHF